MSTARPTEVLLPANDRESKITYQSVVAYHQMKLIGNLEKLMAGTAELVAEVKLIDPGIDQIISGLKANCKKVRTRLHPEKGLMPDAVREAIGAEHVLKSFKEHKPSKINFSFDVSDDNKCELVGIIDDKFADLNIPGVIPAVLIYGVQAKPRPILIGHKTPGDIVELATDLTNFYQVYGKRLIKLNHLSNESVRKIKKVAESYIKQLGRNL